MRTKESKRDLGDLLPLRAALADLQAWETQDRDRRGEDDAVVRALREVNTRLAAALEEAETPDLSDGLTPEEYAKVVGLNVWTVYKKFRRRAIPGAEKRHGRICIPFPDSSAA